MKLNVFAKRKIHALKAKKNWTLILIATSFVASLVFHFILGIDKKTVGGVFFSLLSVLAIAEHHYTHEIKFWKETQFI